MSAPLELRQVSLWLHGARLTPEISCVAAPGEIVTVMGPSGSGKSSLLAFIGGFLGHAFTAEGEVLIGTEAVTRLPPERRQVGILFQDDLLFPHMSVGENLAFGLPPGSGRAERRNRVEEALGTAGLAGYAARDPATLSGGQRARVTLLRTLLAEPRALLLDEPFGKLDRTLRGEIRTFVFEHARIRALPVLLVTHDEQDAAAAGGPIIRL